MSRRMLTGKRAGQMATDAAVERLLLTHIPVWTSINKVVDDDNANRDLTTSCTGTTLQFV